MAILYYQIILWPKRSKKFKIQLQKRCVVQKMNDHFQRPLWPVFIILSKLATTILENDDWSQLSNTIKKIEKFWWKLKEYKILI